MKNLFIGAMGLGTIVGCFWLYAIDAGMNGAEWVPHWRTWAAYASCPFIILIGINRVANICVPLLNGFLYGMLGLALGRLFARRSAG
jgi:hypothetical protein